MAMKLKKIERFNPANPDQKKWYLTRDAGRPVDLDDIAEDIQGRSAMTKGDILSVLSNLVQVLPTHLKRGDSVRLGSFGSFRLSISSAGAESAEALDAGSVKGAKVVFVGGTELKKALSDVTYTVG